MKVLMLGRIELLEVGGGDKIQIENTAAELRKLGVEVNIKTGLDVNLRGYDLVHVFQLDWTPETYLYAKKVKDAGLPLVLSPIHHNIDEVKRFDDEYAFDLRRFSRLILSDQHQRDTFKNLYRCLFDFRKIYPTFYSLMLGLKEMHTRTLTLSDMVLVQTEKEARDLAKTYQVEFLSEKIPNGVGENFITGNFGPNPFEFEDYVICVGRIEPRKNQLKVIEAVEKLRESSKKDIKLVLIGTPVGSKHFEYMWKFEKKLKESPWIKHISKVPYEKMPTYYHFAKVGVSASWFETTGLTSLEALFCRTNAVAAGERAREYLGENASYCDPGDSESIYRAIEKEYFASRPNLSEEMKKEFTWANAAKKTLEVYNKVLAQKL